ncbi:DUF4245 domain-containing protein [Actinomadura kijaniata]|uniref:DUF4245 domain-containing protein n=1 Tax=Actinomadura kijaniata TaxID=46161 RepID=UPI000A5433C4|nr:DUF4245 domain-containing protein [Actinomadura kijaniata]
MSEKTPAPTPESTPAGPEAVPAGPEAASAGPEAASAEPEAAPRPSGPIPVSPAVHKRLTTGLGGFTLAIAACLLLVAVIYAITPRSTTEILPIVDYRSQLWAMSNDAPYRVWAPEGLPDRWRPTSSRVSGLNEKGRPVAWHLGFVTPSDEHAALEQSNEKAEPFIRRMTNDRIPDGAQQVAGAQWTRYVAESRKQNSLVRTLPNGVSVVVTGTASFEELAALASSLKEQRKGEVPLPTSPASPGTPRS